MAAGTEDQARIQPQRDTPVVGSFLPFGDHNQLFTHFNGLVVLTPVVFPIAVFHKGSGELRISFANLPQHGKPGLVVGQVAFDAADAEKSVLQLLVDIVPILMITLKKFLEIILVFDDEAACAHGGHPFTAQVDLFCRGVDGHFNVSHIVPPYSY